MALDKRKLNPGGNSSGIGPVLHTYASGADALTDVAGANYFNDVAGNLKTGDLIWVKPTSGAGALYSVAVSSGVVTLTRMLAAQQTTIVALTDNSGGVASDTLAAITGSYVEATIENTVASLAAKINALRTALVNAGIVAAA